VIAMKIYTVAHVTPELAREWLQHLRDFDTAHPGCHFEILAEAPAVPLADAIDMLRIDPNLNITDILKGERK